MEILDDLNFRVRSRFIGKIRSNFVWGGLLPIIVFGSSNMFLYVLLDKALKGVMIYAVTLLISFSLLYAIHLLLFGRVLDEEYQWGNSDFEEFEDLMLDKFYIKGIVDDELFYAYFDNNARENTDEDYDLYYDYIRRGRVIKCIVSLLIAFGSCIPTILTLA